MIVGRTMKMVIIVFANSAVARPALDTILRLDLSALLPSGILI